MKEYRIYLETEDSNPSLQVRYMDDLHGAPEYIKAVQVWYDVPAGAFVVYLQSFLKLPVCVGTTTENDDVN